MGKRGGWMRLAGWLAPILAVIMLLAACRGGPTPTPTPPAVMTPAPRPATPTPPVAPTPAAPRELIVYTSADFTGPTAVLSAPAVIGADDYFKELNARGGIEGIKIKHIYVDNRYDIGRGVSAYKRVVGNPKLVFVWLHSTPLTKALFPLIKRDKMPTITPGAGEWQHRKTYVFTTATYQDMFAAAIDWAIKDWKDKGKPGMPTIGYMGWDNEYGREAYEKGGKEYAAKVGVKLLPPEYFPVGTPDHTPYLMRLKDADYIFMAAPDPAGPAIIRDAQRLGLLRKIQFIADIWSVSKPGLKLRPELIEGTVTLGHYLRGDEAERSYATELWQKYQKKPVAEMSELYLVGVAQGMLFEQALRNTLKEVSYEEITPEDVYRGLMAVKDFDARGMFGKFSYGPTERRTRTIRFYQARGGKWVPITDWVTAPDAVALHKWE